jgi:hypothetical protein
MTQVGGGYGGEQMVWRVTTRDGVWRVQQKIHLQEDRGFF